MRFIALMCAILGLACSPKECKDAKPAIAETQAALASGKVSTAAAPAKKLAAALAGTSGDLAVLEHQSKSLSKALESASKPASSPEEGQRSAANLKSAISAWKSAATRVCK